MARPLSIFVNIGAKLAPSLNAAAGAAERRIATMGRTMRLRIAETKASFAGIGRDLQGFGTHVSLPMAAFATIGGRAAYQWSKVGNELQAVSQMGDSARKSIEGIARAMPGDPTKNLSIALDLARTGFTPEAIKGSLAVTMKLSRADNSLSPADAADMMTNVMTGMKLFNDKMSASQIGSVAERVANNLAVGAAKSSSDLRLMGESFKYAAPLASRLGIEIEDLTAYFMTMADNGIKGSEAGVAFRSGMVRLLKPTKSAMAVLERYNMKLGDYVSFTNKPTGATVVASLKAQGIAADGARGSIDALLRDPNLTGAALIQRISQAIADGMAGGADAADLDKISDGVADAIMSGASKVDFAKFLEDARRRGFTAGDIVNFFDTRQGARLSTLIGPEFERNRQAVLSAVKVAQGKGTFLDQMYATQMKGAVGPWERMQQGFGNLIISMAESGVMDTVARGMNAIANGMMSLSQTNPTALKLITYTILGLAAAAPIGFALKGVGLGLNLLRIGALKAATPLGLLLRLFGGLTSVIGRGLLAGIQGLATSAFLRSGLSALGPFFMSGLRALGPFLLAGVRLAFGVLSGPVGWALLAASAAALAWKYRDSIAGAWTAVVGWFKTVAWPAVVATASGIFTAGGRLVDSIINGLAASWGRLKSWFAARWNGLAPSFMQIGGSAPASPPPPTTRRARGGPVVRLPGRATGGPVSAGRAYMVGEEGPEPFIPNTSGTIIPHDKAFAGARGGASLHIDRFIIQGANDPAATAREVERVLKRLARGQSALLSD